MSTGGAPDNQGSSTRPYLLRALHDWCTDNGFTPYIAVHVDATVQVPNEYVKNNEIVLNVGFEATSGLKLGNQFIEFKARFGGVGREIVVPVDHVVAIYARENGQGMAFPMPAYEGAPAGADVPGGSAASRGAAAAGAGAPGRGLRLARKGPEVQAGSAAKSGQARSPLTTAAPASLASLGPPRTAGTSAQNDPPAPEAVPAPADALAPPGPPERPEPPEPGAPRPSLKRVK
jgi:stringent starvation protein B